MSEADKNTIAKQIIIKQDEDSYYVNSFVGLDAYGRIEGETLDWENFLPTALNKCRDVDQQYIYKKGLLNSW